MAGVKLQSLRAPQVQAQLRHPATEHRVQLCRLHCAPERGGLIGPVLCHTGGLAPVGWPQQDGPVGCPQAWGTLACGF